VRSDLLIAPATLDDEVRRALAEDLGPGDATAALVPEGQRVRATIVAKEPGVLAGRPWAEACFRALDDEVAITWGRADGETFDAGTVLCGIVGRARALLSAERSALNFMQTLSATATQAAAYVAAVSGTRATILDTRKTLPGLRLAQKYAVRCGGASNHRMGLHDAVLIKENHIACAGSVAAAVAAARRAAPDLTVEVEVETLQELREALDCAPDRIMLDDFDLAGLREAVAIAAGRVPLEASGGMSLDAIRAVAATGVDFISVGALTKHVRAIDLSMRVDWGA
jgi:nicotinate-nucleotide pyrophosphorylase (carboxylating)